jgi:hypothetical protein
VTSSAKPRRRPTLMAEDAHVDLHELIYEARLAVAGLIVGVGGLLKQNGTPELITASHYLSQAGVALDAAEALLALKPVPLAPLRPLMEELPKNVIAFPRRSG